MKDSRVCALQNERSEIMQKIETQRHEFAQCYEELESAQKTLLAEVICHVPSFSSLWFLIYGDLSVENSQFSLLDFYPKFEDVLLALDAEVLRAKSCDSGLINHVIRFQVARLI